MAFSRYVITRSNPLMTSIMTFTKHTGEKVHLRRIQSNWDISMGVRTAVSCIAFLSTMSLSNEAIRAKGRTKRYLHRVSPNYHPYSELRVALRVEACSDYCS